MMLILDICLRQVRMQSFTPKVDIDIERDRGIYSTAQPPSRVFEYSEQVFRAFCQTLREAFRIL